MYRMSSRGIAAARGVGGHLDPDFLFDPGPHLGRLGVVAEMLQRPANRLWTEKGEVSGGPFYPIQTFKTNLAAPSATA